ncbi:hypothetical protein MRX96_010311 [Rhipicephalus microplus]
MKGRRRLAEVTTPGPPLTWYIGVALRGGLKGAWRKKPRRVVVRGAPVAARLFRPDGTQARRLKGDGLVMTA